MRLSAAGVERALAWVSVLVALGIAISWGSGASVGRWTLVSPRRRASLMREHSTDSMTLVAAALLVVHAWSVRRDSPWSSPVSSAARAMLLVLGVTERALDIEILVVWIVAWCDLHPALVMASIAWLFAHTGGLGAAQVSVFVLACLGTAAVSILDARRKDAGRGPEALSARHALAVLGAIGLAVNRE